MKIKSGCETFNVFASAHVPVYFRVFGDNLSVCLPKENGRLEKFFDISSTPCLSVRFDDEIKERTISVVDGIYGLPVLPSEMVFKNS